MYCGTAVFGQGLENREADILINVYNGNACVCVQGKNANYIIISLSVQRVCRCVLFGIYRRSQK